MGEMLQIWGNVAGLLSIGNFVLKLISLVLHLPSSTVLYRAVELGK